MATQSYGARITSILAQHEITEAQFSILFHLLQHRGTPQTISQIAATVDVNQPAVTKIVQKFETLGKVRIVKSETDQRQRHVQLARKGELTIDAIQRQLRPDFANMFADWSPDELEQFNQGLAKTVTWLEKNQP